MTSKLSLMGQQAAQTLHDDCHEEDPAALLKLEKARYDNYRRRSRRRQMLQPAEMRDYKRLAKKLDLPLVK